MLDARRSLFLIYSEARRSSRSDSGGPRWLRSFGGRRKPSNAEREAGLHRPVFGKARLSSGGGGGAGREEGRVPNGSWDIKKILELWNHGAVSQARERPGRPDSAPARRHEGSQPSTASHVIAAAGGGEC